MTAFPTAVGVSRALGKRFTRATSTGTMVRGYRHRTAGFKVTNTPSGKIKVEHQFSSGRFNDDTDHAAVQAERTRTYASYLASNGYAVETHGSGVFAACYVTGKL